MIFFSSGATAKIKARRSAIRFALPESLGLNTAKLLTLISLWRERIGTRLLYAARSFVISGGEALVPGSRVREGDFDGVYEVTTASISYSRSRPPPPRGTNERFLLLLFPNFHDVQLNLCVTRNTENSNFRTLVSTNQSGEPTTRYKISHVVFFQQQSATQNPTERMHYTRRNTKGRGVLFKKQSKKFTPPAFLPLCARRVVSPGLRRGSKVSSFVISPEREKKKSEEGGGQESQ